MHPDTLKVKVPHWVLRLCLPRTEEGHGRVSLPKIFRGCELKVWFHDIAGRYEEVSLDLVQHRKAGQHTLVGF